MDFLSTAAKRFHCDARLAADSLLLNQTANRGKDNRQICPKAHLVHILYIECESFLPAQEIAAVRLRQTGKSRTDFMPPVLGFGIQRKILYKQRPRTDQAHVASKDIVKLRQFVKACATKKLTELGKPYLIRQQISVGIPCVGHGTEFIQTKELFIFSRSYLTEEDRLAEKNAYKQREKRKQGGETNQNKPGYKYIQNALDVSPV